MSDFLNLLGFKSIIIFISSAFSIILILLATDVVTTDDVVDLLGLCNQYVENSDSSVVPDKLQEIGKLENNGQTCASREVLEKIVNNLRNATISIIDVIKSLSQKLLNWTDGK